GIVLVIAVARLEPGVGVKGALLLRNPGAAPGGAPVSLLGAEPVAGGASCSSGIRSDGSQVVTGSEQLKFEDRQLLTEEPNFFHLLGPLKPEITITYVAVSAIFFNSGLSLKTE
ncbi:hypothetical protein DV515_00008508, partial [Chloebia gouldiae]